MNYARHLTVSGKFLVNLGIFFRISSLVSKTILKMHKLDMENKHHRLDIRAANMLSISFHRLRFLGATPRCKRQRCLPHGWCLTLQQPRAARPNYELSWNQQLDLG